MPCKRYSISQAVAVFFLNNLDCSVNWAAKDAMAVAACSTRAIAPHCLLALLAQWGAQVCPTNTILHHRDTVKASRRPIRADFAFAVIDKEPVAGQCGAK